MHRRDQQTIASALARELEPALTAHFRSKRIVAQACGIGQPQVSRIINGQIISWKNMRCIIATLLREWPDTQLPKIRYYWPRMFPDDDLFKEQADANIVSRRTGEGGE
jgi:predicted XRE-type DNA-binding protein